MSNCSWCCSYKNDELYCATVLNEHGHEFCFGINLTLRTKFTKRVNLTVLANLKILIDGWARDCSVGVVGPMSTDVVSVQRLGGRAESVER